MKWLLLSFCFCGIVNQTFAGEVRPLFTPQQSINLSLNICIKMAEYYRDVWAEQASVGCIKGAQEITRIAFERGEVGTPEGVVLFTCVNNMNNDQISLQCIESGLALLMTEEKVSKLMESCPKVSLWNRSVENQKRLQCFKEKLFPSP